MQPGLQIGGVPSHGAILSRVLSNGRAADFDVNWQYESLFGTVYGVICNEHGYRAKTPLVVRVVKAIDGYCPKFVNAASASFRAKLANLGVRLSKEYRFHIVDNHAVQVSSHEGENLEDILMNNRELIHTQLPAVAKSVAGVIRNGQSRGLGLDPKLSNFGNDGVYVDTFPPLLRFRGQWLVHYPNPSDEQTIQRELQRKFKPFAVLRKLRFFLIAVNPEWDSFFKEAVWPLLTGELASIKTFLESLPDRGVKSIGTQGRFQLLNEYFQVGKDIETMREITAQIVPMDWEHRYKFLTNSVFRYSSSYEAPGYPPTYEERLEMLRKVLAICISSGEPPVIV